MLYWISRLRPILLITALLTPVAPLFAAPDADSIGTVRGVVQVADTGEPIPGANVAVRTVTDSTLVGGAAADSSGRFVVADLSLGRYDVVASVVGYETASRRVHLTQARPTQTLDAFRLSRTTDRMRGVEVAAERAFVTTEGSKKVYNFDRAQVALGGKSAVDVLRDLPSIRIDLDGSIQLRGSENVNVHINGKPAAMEGKALVQYLKGLSADDIERVEVNTNPSARHDAEGTAGIINLVLDRTDDPGWNGSLSASGGIGPRLSGSGNVGYSQEPWTVHGSYSYRHAGQDRTQELVRSRPDEASSILLDQRTAEALTFGGHSFSAQVDYALTPATTLSLVSTGSARGMDQSQSVAYRQANEGEAGSSIDRETAEDRHYMTLDERLSFSHELGDDHELTADLRYQRTEHGQSFVEEQTRSDEPRERGENEEVEHTPSMTIDYTRPLGAWTMETGYKQSFRHLEQEYTADRYDSVRDRFVQVPDRGQAFTFEEHVYAVYGTLQRGIGPLEAEAGLRVEHTQTTVDPREAASHDNRYTDVYPSASLTYSASKARQLSLSYSKRVNRPSFYQLSSFGALSNPYLRFEGNPTLEPEQVHKMELTLVQHAGPATITLSPYGKHTVNTIDWETSVESDSLTVRTYDNYDASTSLGIELSSSMRLGKTLQASLSGNAYRIRTRGGSLQGGVTRDAFAVSARANATWTVRPGLRLQVSQYYRSPITTGLGRMDAFLRTQVAVEHTFWNDRATLGLRLQDPFDTSDMGFEKRNSRFYERMTNNWDGRRVSLSFSYRFGDADKKQRRNRPSSSGGGMSPMGGG